jgi:hypothetical protein
MSADFLFSPQARSQRAGVLGGFSVAAGAGDPGLDKAARQVTDLLDNELATSGS